MLSSSMFMFDILGQNEELWHHGIGKLLSVSKTTPCKSLEYGCVIQLCDGGETSTHIIFGKFALM